MCIPCVTQPLAEEVHLKYQRWMQLLEHSGRHRPNVLDKGPAVIGYQATLAAIRDEYGGRSGSGKVPPRAHPSMSIQVNTACCFSPPRLSIKGFPGGSEVKNSQECRFNPWVGKISGRRKWQPTPVFLPGKSHAQRSLVGYSPWGGKESERT